jgi:hypothetical protein
MARMMGRTKTLAWWLVGICCAMFFGRAAAGEAVVQPAYGVPVRFPRKVAKPAVTEKQKQQANKLVDEYLAGSSEKLTADEKKKIAKLVKDLGSDEYATREAASKAIIKFGSKALKQLKAALKSKDAEVVQRADAAIKEIGQSGGGPVIAGLRKIRAASLAVINQRKGKWKTAAYTAELQSIALKAQGKKKAAEKKLAEKKQADEKVKKLATLLGLVGGGVRLVPGRPRPGRPVAKYGVRIRPILLK